MLSVVQWASLSPQQILLRMRKLMRLRKQVRSTRAAEYPSRKMALPPLRMQESAGSAKAQVVAFFFLDLSAFYIGGFAIHYIVCRRLLIGGSECLEVFLNHIGWAHLNKEVIPETNHSGIIEGVQTWHTHDQIDRRHHINQRADRNKLGPRTHPWISHQTQYQFRT